MGPGRQKDSAGPDVYLETEIGPSRAGNKWQIYDSEGHRKADQYALDG